MSKLSFLKNMNRNTILVCIAIVAVVITGFLIAGSNGGFTMPTIFGASDSQLGKAVIDYINNNQLSQTPATLVKVGEESGLVKVTIKIGTNNFDSYVTKDGKLLFPQAYNIAPKKDAKTTAQNTNTNSTPNTTAVTKTDKPLLEAYIVSSCPYGLQMQRAVAEAVRTSSALASYVKMRYIGSISNGTIVSMHGPEEAQENLRQICIRDEQPTKYWSYVSCYMKKATGQMANGMPIGDSKTCQASTGVDSAKLNACVADPKRGLADAQADFDLANKNNVSGSPTLVLNGTTVSESNYGGRAADAVRAMVCAGATTQSSFCSAKLNTAEATVSFAATYADASGSSASSANTNCAPAAQ